MKYERLLMIVNLLLVCVCGASIYYLVTTGTGRPNEVIEAERMLAKLDGAETNFNPGNETAYAIPSGEYRGVVKKQWMNDLYTPTPTPTPPPPTPVPEGKLAEGVYAWKVMSLDTNTADFIDERTKENFRMTVGGETRTVYDKHKRPVEVKLLKVDMSALNCTLGFKDQREVRNF